MKGLSLKKGNKTYLLYKNITTKKPNDKLDFKKLGLFIINRKILENNYKLLLPKIIQIHLIFYISLFESTLKSIQPQEEQIKIALD
jgi:hypothetical protein